LRKASQLKISYVSQDTSHLQGNLTDYAAGNEIDESLFKAILRKLDFSRVQFEKDISSFSGGQKKKVLIANQMGFQADAIFAMNYTEIDSVTAWIGILAYTFQIYFDFSGYSDMAIGLGKMIGFKFPENFNSPYVSQSITEFWRRWHMTLGAWMRNYLYIPLGGNRVNSKWRLYFNLWLVFLASGLWHGASWGFVIWGAYHGLFLVLERGFLLKIYSKIGKIPSIIITFFIVVIGWVFFRVENVNDALTFLNRMFAFEFTSMPVLTTQFVFFLLIAVFFAFFSITNLGERIQNEVFFGRYPTSRHLSFSFIAIALLLLSVRSITSFGFNPFIYFRF
jgi:alginate O-acetyltransferase complex protein AlgI